jgi:hypothetical protein
MTQWSGIIDKSKTIAFPYCVGVAQAKTEGGLHDEGEDVKTFLALTRPEPAWGARWFLLSNTKFEGGELSTSSPTFQEIKGNRLEK